MLRGDQKSRYEAYAIGRQWGWLSVNDIRRLENMPPVPGGDGREPGIVKAATEALRRFDPYVPVIDVRVVR